MNKKSMEIIKSSQNYWKRKYLLENWSNKNRKFEITEAITEIYQVKSINFL